MTGAGMLPWAALVAVLLLLVMVVAGISAWTARTRCRQESACAGYCWCGSCDLANTIDHGKPGDLFDAPSTMPGGTPLKPVNEPHGDRWADRDRSPNRGAWFDEASRRANQANARWITAAQQRKYGEVLVGEVEQHLVAVAAAEQARREHPQQAPTEGWTAGDLDE